MTRVNMGASADAETGSRPTDQAASRLDGSRFDPARIEKLLKRATPLPWAWEQCGEKCDDPVIGVAWRIDDETCTAIPGFLGDFDSNGNAIEYYRESIAYLGDANSPDASASANAMLIVEAINALPQLLAIAMEARQGGDVQQAPSASADDSAVAKPIAQKEEQ